MELRKLKRGDCLGCDVLLLEELDVLEEIDAVTGPEELKAARNVPSCFK